MKGEHQSALQDCFQTTYTKPAGGKVISAFNLGRPGETVPDLCAAPRPVRLHLHSNPSIRPVESRNEEKKLFRGNFRLKLLPLPMQSEPPSFFVAAFPYTYNANAEMNLNLFAPILHK